MENLDFWAIFSNPCRDNSSKTKYLINTTLFLHFFSRSSQKQMIGIDRMTNKYLTFLVNVLFTLKHSFGEFPIHKFHNHCFSGVCCILSRRQSVTTFNGYRIYINSGIFTDSDYGLFESWNFIRSPKYFDIVTSVALFWNGLLFLKIYYSILKVLLGISDNQQFTAQFLVRSHKTIYILWKFRDLVVKSLGFLKTTDQPTTYHWVNSPTTNQPTSNQ